MISENEKQILFIGGTLDGQRVTKEVAALNLRYWMIPAVNPAQPQILIYERLGQDQNYNLLHCFTNLSDFYKWNDETPQEYVV